MTNEGPRAPRPADTLPVRLTKSLRSAYLAYDKANKRRLPDRDDRALLLATMAQAGREAGWPIATLAQHCGRTPEESISPERLRQIIASRLNKAEVAGTPLPDVPVFPPRRRVVKEVPPPKNRRRPLTKEEYAALEGLAPVARKNTGSRPLDHPSRDASAEFSALIMQLHDDNVTWDAMTKPTGLTIAGLRMRAARHGYGKGAPPSIQPYRNIALHPAKPAAVKPPITAKPRKAVAKTAVKSTTSKKVAAKKTA